MHTPSTGKALTRRALALGCGVLCTVAIAACTNGSEVTPPPTNDANTTATQSSTSEKRSSTASSTTETSESESSSKSMSPQVRSGGVPRIGQPCPGRSDELNKGANGQMLQCTNIGGSLVWSVLPDDGTSTAPQTPPEGSSPSSTQPPSSDSATPGTTPESPTPTDGSAPSGSSESSDTDIPGAANNDGQATHGNQRHSDSNSGEPDRPNQSGSTPEQELQLLFSL